MADQAAAQQSSHSDLASSNPSLLLKDIAYERIKEAIRLAELQPGQPLSETRLSKQLGISRTPVREALQVLAQEGLVQVIPGRAVTVAAPSLREVMDAIHIRSVLEPELVRLATKAITEDQLAILWTALGDLESAVSKDDRLAWSNADNTFHETISEACPNQLLGELSLQIRNRIAHLSIDIGNDVERLQQCTYEHRIIVERMAVGDAKGTEEATRDHINMLRESILRRYSHNY